ncbi:putative BTB/POZ domain-containing protein AtSIBP1 [Helianthus debilis subsp. tardiflorus]
MSSVNKDSPPIASFIIRVVSSLGGRKALVHPEIRDKQLKSSDDFVWALEVPLTGKFIIELEFLDLKAASPNVILPLISLVKFTFVINYITLGILLDSLIRINSWLVNRKLSKCVVG